MTWTGHQSKQCIFICLQNFKHAVHLQCRLLVYEQCQQEAHPFRVDLKGMDFSRVSQLSKQWRDSVWLQFWGGFGLDSQNNEK